MNNIYNRETKYNAFSLLEMIITTFIIGFIMIIVALVLTTLIKVSVVTTNKTAARNDSEFVLELLRRNIKSSNPDHVRIYNSHNNRIYNKETGRVTDIGFQETQDWTSVGPGEKGNEIHFRPQGSQNWVCIAYYWGPTWDVEKKKDEKGENIRMGYILKVTKDKDEYALAKDCFGVLNSKHSLMVLNSKSINVKDFSLLYRTHGEDAINKIIQIDMLVQPVHWYFAKGAPINREVYRQAIITTESIKW
ncbi:MAG: hypothetical protein ACOX06_00410 [Candidatus Dojkabacteria bacterium]|jgi:competence protein ComGC